MPIATLDDARKVMARKKAIGGLYIKSYKQPARSARQQLVRAGREAGIMVDVEGESHFYYNITMLMDGHTNLEHNMPVANYYDDIVQLMSRGHALQHAHAHRHFRRADGRELHVSEHARLGGSEGPQVRAGDHQLLQPAGRDLRRAALRAWHDLDPCRG